MKCVMTELSVKKKKKSNEKKGHMDCEKKGSAFRRKRNKEPRLLFGG